MAYRQRKYVFRNAVEVEQYHSQRYGPPGGRSPREKPTPEQMEKINHRLKVKTCRHKLRQNFDINDYFVCLSYRVEERPESMEQAKKDWQRFITKVRREYKKRGAELKWIRNIEVGSRGAWHTHLIMNRIPDTDIILAKCWTHGRVWHELLHDRGEFRELAEYVTKDEKSDPKLKEASYSTSRNLPTPEPKKRDCKRKTWPSKMWCPKGFYIDKDSIEEGINRMGYEYRSYTVLRTRRI
ncbi:MAG: hypothetical protein MSH32_03670 [Lachnospiraceae bacterium]|nr:hypothetical protein [Lachnospiraceae bacterium]